MKEDITDMLLSRYVQSYGKRPDGTTVVPWSCGQLLVWYATFPDMLATSYDARLHVLPANSKVAAAAEERKVNKYANLGQAYFFTPVAIETWVPLAQRHWPL